MNKLTRFIETAAIGLFWLLLLTVVIVILSACATAPIKQKPVPVEEEATAKVFFMGTRPKFKELYVCELAEADPVKKLPEDGLYCVDYTFFMNRMLEISNADTEHYNP